MAGNKFGAKKVIDPITGFEFDSKKEHRRWQELMLLERAGKISNLRRQVKYELIPTQREESTEVYKAGPQKGLPKPGTLIEKECAYIADFVYRDADGQLVVEDTKSEATKTEAYKIKRKLLLYKYGIKIREV
jgi:hypothetical protein